MTNQSEDRALTLGLYIAEEGATVRAAAQKFGVSKSTVPILDRNKSERHIRGGMATKRKYAQQGKTPPLC